MRYIWDNEQKKLVEYEKREPEGQVYIIGDIKPYWDDNMDAKPIYVQSRRHKRQLLKERGLDIL
uniref:Uncharacterized protein n=1 Tax=viral metagenome TaxID=1070528 RepID=A0A6M3K5B1_9ZZZZ